MKKLTAIAALALMAACNGAGDDSPSPDAIALDRDDAEAEDIQEVETAGPLTVSQEGATPMAERVATIGVLNKRNGLSRDIELRPGEQTRVGDVLIQLRACEHTAPWETQQLTGIFVRIFARDTDMRQGEDRPWRRIFSGWLFKERPALNVVEHRIYDVYPKACAMTWPDSAPSSSAPASRSSAPTSAPAEPANDAGSAEAEPAAPASDDSAESSNEE